MFPTPPHCGGTAASLDNRPTPPDCGGVWRAVQRSRRRNIVTLVPLSVRATCTSSISAPMMLSPRPLDSSSCGGRHEPSSVTSTRIDRPSFPPCDFDEPRLGAVLARVLDGVGNGLIDGQNDVLGPLDLLRREPIADRTTHFCQPPCFGFETEAQVVYHHTAPGWTR
jgi:hypothetical protein